MAKQLELLSKQVVALAAKFDPAIEAIAGVREALWVVVALLAAILLVMLVRK